jgi:hypothetical protein
MAKCLPIALTFLLAGCSSPEERRTGAIMDSLEQQVQLPKGARPLSAYARYYAFGRTGDVEALYLIPWQDEVRPGESCEELTVNFTSHAVPCSDMKSKGEELKVGQRRWVVDSRHFPLVLDGGCGVISLLFDAKTAKAKSVECNGEA